MAKGSWLPITGWGVRLALGVSLTVLFVGVSQSPSMSATTTLSASQVPAACLDFSAMQVQVKSAIAVANAAVFSNNAAKQVAIGQAIASVTRVLLSKCGVEGAGPVTSIVIVTATDIGVDNATLGVGLGLVAAQSNPSIARVIARTVANESESGVAFATAFMNAGGTAEISALATSAPNVTAVTAVRTAVTTPVPVPPTGRPSPCARPSCS